MSNIFDQFQTEEKSIEIKALGGEVTIRQMSYNEAVMFSKRLFSGADADGNPKFNTSEYVDMRAEKVAKCMISPKMTVKAIKELPASASDAIAEIADAIDSFQEGNQKS